MTRRYHHGNLRAAIVAVARDELRRSAGADLSLRALARIAGVSTNAPYRHFPGKDGLTVALAADGYREITQVAELALEAPESIKALVDGLAEFGNREAALLTLLGEETFRGRDPESDVVLARDEWFATLVAIVEKVTNDLAPGEGYRRAAAIWAILIGAQQLRTHGGRGLLTAEFLPDAAELCLRVATGR